MRLLTLFTILILATSCSKTTEQESNNTPGIEFLENIKSLENKDNKTPIITFRDFAISSADKSIKLTKKNITSALTKAKAYKHCVIIVGMHTIVKITDLNNCKQSGSWGACMPLAEGYIKKGGLKHQKDYINNIIGLPDSQVRIMYLFN